MCVASIRYWHPERAVYLLKDEGRGKFDTQEIEKALNVEVLDFGQPLRYSSPAAKLEVLYLPVHALYLDSDIILVGPVLDLLEKNGEDFLVSPSRIHDPGHDHLTDLYYNWSQMRKFDPAFQYPGYVFNAGRFVCTGGILERHEVDRFFTPPRIGKLSHPDVFRNLDQGVLNYLLPKIAQEGRATVGLVDFKLFAYPTVIGEERVPMAAQRDKTAPPALIHYAGEKFPLNRQCLRPDLLDFYERLYYSRVPRGSLLRRLRAVRRFAQWFPRYWSRQLRSRVPRPLRKLARSLIS
jgi:hypothetical protein